MNNYYQNNHNTLQNPNNIQKITDYTEQELKGSSSTNCIYQNASNKIQLLKKKFWTEPLFFKKSKE